MRMGGKQLQGIEDRLQKDSVFVREDGGDNVHQLRHVGDFDDVRVIDERIQETRDDQRVFKIVVFLQNAPSSLLVAPSPIPNVPLIPRDIQLLVRGHVG